VLASIRGWAVSAAPRELAIGFAIGIVYTGMTVLFFVSLRHLKASLVTIGLYTHPVFVFSLAVPFSNEEVTAGKLVALGAVLAGVTPIVDANMAGVEPLGVAFALSAAGWYALYTTASRAIVPLSDHAPFIFCVLLGTAVSMAGFWQITGSLSLPRGVDEWVIVLGLTVIGTVLPLLLFCEGVARLEASRVGVGSIEPLITVVLGGGLLGEPVTPAVIGGGVLVVQRQVKIGRASVPRP